MFMSPHWQDVTSTESSDGEAVWITRLPVRQKDEQNDKAVEERQENNSYTSSM